MWNEYKANKFCERCGETNPIVLAHHHINPAEKTFNVSGIWYIRPWKTVMDEVKKCSVLCANCHCIVEHELRAIKRKAG